MKTGYKILFFLLGVSLAVNIGFAFAPKDNMMNNSDDTEEYIVYEQNLSTLSARCYDLEQGLSKLVICNEPNESIRILTDIIDDSGAAVTSLSVLPLYPGYIAKLNRYLNHVSDYSKFMLFMSADGRVPSVEYEENITALKKSVSEVNKALNELEKKVQNSPIEWEKLTADGVSELDMLDNVFSSTIESIQTEGIDYPTLIYDGPFSDSVVNKVIDEKGTFVSRDDAVNIFKKFIDADDSWNEYAASECGGIIDTWCITLEKDGEYYYANIAKNTGFVVSFINSGRSYEQRLSKDEAIQSAEEFLEKNNFKNMVPQYCQTSNGNATINFVYERDGVLIYPDMVKVRVDMENGTVNGFEGMSYYANHREERELDFNTMFTIENAAAKLSSKLTVESSTKAVIPTDGGNELLCYEFRCNSEDGMYIVYFDVKTQKQVKIFKILTTENGDFVV